MPGLFPAPNPGSAREANVCAACTVTPGDECPNDAPPGYPVSVGACFPKFDPMVQYGLVAPPQRQTNPCGPPRRHNPTPATMDAAAARATAQHTQALLETDVSQLPPWARHKISRARQRMSDVAWFMAHARALNGHHPSGYVVHQNLQQLADDADWIADRLERDGVELEEWASDHISTAYTDIHDVYAQAVRGPTTREDNPGGIAAPPGVDRSNFCQACQSCGGTCTVDPFTSQPHCTGKVDAGCFADALYIVASAGNQPAPARPQRPMIAAAPAPRPTAPAPRPVAQRQPMLTLPAPRGALAARPRLPGKRWQAASMIR